MTRKQLEEVEVLPIATGLISFEDLLALDDLVDLNEIAPSGVLDKETLIGVPFVAIDWAFREGSYGSNSEFVVVQIVCADNTRGVMVDGSTGIKEQLKLVTERMMASGGMRPLVVKGGLYKSEYSNEYGPGVTFYLGSNAKK